MKTAVLASLIASAAAFAPAKQAATSSSLKAFENELGAQDPLGFFDPLGLVSDGDEAKFQRLRYVELKHGRIAQLAFLGNIIPRAGIYLPGNIDFAGDSFDSYPAGWAAISGPDAIPSAGVGQILAFIGFLELFVMKDVTGEAEFPGDFRNGYIDFGWDTFGPATVSLNVCSSAKLVLPWMTVPLTHNLIFCIFFFFSVQKLRKRAIELNNGRAAMMGILGLMMHEQIDGNPVIGVFLEY